MLFPAYIMMTEYGRLQWSGEHIDPKVRSAIIAFGTKLFQEDFADTEGELQGLFDRFQQRHFELMPPYLNDTATHRGIAEHPLIPHEMANIAQDELDREDFGKALEHGNHTYYYGELAHQDGLSPFALILSFVFHKNFTRAIVERFKDQDPTLRNSGEETLRKIKEFEAIKDLHSAVELSRALIHMTALQGILGEDARKAVDPLAIVAIPE